jgi:hypothetical protein
MTDERQGAKPRDHDERHSGDDEWIAVGTHVVGWGLMWPVLRDKHHANRALLLTACALIVAAAVFMLLGLGEYGQWRQYESGCRSVACGWQAG